MVALKQKDSNLSDGNRTPSLPSGSSKNSGGDSGEIEESRNQANVRLIHRLETEIEQLKERIEQNKVLTNMIINDLKHPTERIINILVCMERELKKIKLNYSIKVEGEMAEIL